MNLYTEYAEKFSDTRNNPWRGWSKLISYLKLLNRPVSVLDLGCGNGRFLKYLENEIELKSDSIKFKVEKYVGVDNSKEMLAILQKQLELYKDITFTFSNLDLNQVLELDFGCKFDLIVGFGIMHHINNLEARKSIYRNIQKLLASDGIAALSFWQFDRLKNFESKVIKKINNTDFILNFSGNETTRFAHKYNVEEINDLEKDLKLLERFEADGNNKNLNEYRIYGQR